MSVDVIDKNQSLQSYPVGGGTRAALRGRTRTPITDIVVIFGGWGGVSDAGKPLQTNVNPPTGTSQLVQRVRRIQNTPLHRIQVVAYHGSLRDSLGINRAFNFIRSNFDPLGRLIIYGYSAGGFDALRLSSHIWLARRYYELSSESFRRSRRDGHTVGFVRIDLLITVDAAVGPISSIAFRRVQPCVRKNLNFYQRFSSGVVRSHGEPNRAVDKRATLIDNRDLSSRYRNTPDSAHGLIDNDTLDDVIQAIRGTFGYQLHPQNLPSGTAAV